MCNLVARRSVYSGTLPKPRVSYFLTNPLLQTGGQDDLLTIFSPWEQRVIARCQGHSSFVSAVAFDDLRCDGRTYRFGSVGEDNKLILVGFLRGLIQSLYLNFFTSVGFLKWCPSPAKVSSESEFVSKSASIINASSRQLITTECQ